MSGLFHITDPTATTGFFDTAAKRNFRSVSGSRHSTGVLTEASLQIRRTEVFSRREEPHKLIVCSRVRN